MNELFIELFSEEIPARMQKTGAETLGRLIGEALKPLKVQQVKLYSTPRRIAGCFIVEAEIPASVISERGPRETAPEKALEGFLRKFQATQNELTKENGFWVLHRNQPAIPAEAFIAKTLPELLWQFPWPKSQRWGKGSTFTWVRPLHKILCLLNGKVVYFPLSHNGDTGHDDTGHNLSSGSETAGHHFLSSGFFSVSSCKDWEEKLSSHFVIADTDQRRKTLLQGLEKLTEAENLTIAPDTGLVEEVTGLVEWPVPFLGRIEESFMDLPIEVMQVSMRVNQRYFTLLHKGTHQPAPWFAFVANIPPSDGGTLTVKGNERVLRARFADARYFWDHDRKTPLFSKLDRLKAVTFHAKLGTQFERTQRLISLSSFIAKNIGASPTLAERSALLCKIDLTTGMVGEFPELQGVMGGYYALHDQEDPACAQAITEHYSPKGVNDGVPTAPVSISLALADKIDTLAGFFAVGEKPTGSGDPYALRRAALGVLRMIRENQLSLALEETFQYALSLYPETLSQPETLQELMEFIRERLRIQLRSEDVPHDILAAILSAASLLDVNQIVERIKHLTQFLKTEEGLNLLAVVKRANNILRIENRKDGPHHGDVTPNLLTEPSEQTLYKVFSKVLPATQQALQDNNYPQALTELSSTRSILDTFFETVTVNDPSEDLRKNRLKLLSQLTEMAKSVADFTQIDG
ncbi:glycine--tRNA ligase subunit beta [Entomobacter blattae]|uniref:Glycine--tRNA ligase beta subunit n=1 Tax=Entomobacter blattae TaxID=2762277 RepID=A0A7H1NUW1_9PROT|nr:glycine--tRNA ligase subunit beta [Entomobacter blattae]QNT79571.1 Glycine--tRNA ligase beta subunit [Entomobacter blattae]